MSLRETGKENFEQEEGGMACSAKLHAWTQLRQSGFTGHSRNKACLAEIKMTILESVGFLSYVRGKTLWDFTPK